MTQTIEQLTARVRELEEEVKTQKTLREESQDHHRACIIEAYKQLGIYEGEDDEFRFKWVSLEIHRLNEKLAASQLHAEQLREALETLNKVSDIGCERVGKALALPHSTSALDAYVADKAQVIIESARELCTDQQKQIATLTRQRDLAVEALEWAADVLPPSDPGGIGGCDCPVCRALEAIKGSEAMAQGEKK